MVKVLFKRKFLAEYGNTCEAEKTFFAPFLSVQLVLVCLGNFPTTFSNMRFVLYMVPVHTEIAKMHW